MPSKVEKFHERKFAALCKRVAFECIKLTTAGPFGQKGWPDRLVIGLGFIVFFEFKREGKKATPLQKSCHRILKALGHHVYVVHSWEEAARITVERFRAQDIPEGLYRIRDRKRICRILLGSRAREDDDYVANLPYFKKSRHRRRTTGDRKSANHLQRLAKGDSEVASWVKSFDRPRKPSKKNREAVRTI